MSAASGSGGSCGGKSVHASRTGVAIFGHDDRLMLHTPGSVELLGLDEAALTPAKSLDDLHAELRATHPFVEQLPCGSVRCRTNSGRTTELAFERLADHRLYVSIVDISEERAIAAELRRARSDAEAASQAKSRFLATMSHELRTPLNAVIGFSDALTREALGAKPIDRAHVTEFSTAIQVAGQTLLDLINTVLDVANVESGNVELASDAIDVLQMVQSCARQAADVAKPAEVSLETVACDDGWRLRGDERRLRQVMAHLLTNAVKFTPRGGRVVVALETASNGDLLIRVRDSGIGISEEYIESVFEPFNQLDTGLARRVSGAGLGLYFCRALVQAHGGHLTIDSKPGEGTAATVRLPQARLIAAPIPLEFTQEQS